MLLHSHSFHPSSWTTRADVPREVGETLTLGFPVAPAPFNLQLEKSDDRTVAWRSETFPPHWVGTTIRRDVEARDGGSVVSFRHDGFDMVQLERYAETGNPTPVDP